MGGRTHPFVGVFLMVTLVGTAVNGGPVLDPVAVSDNNSSNTEPDFIERGNQLVDEALVPVYELVKGFLETVVQPNDLTYMEEKGVDFSDPDNILDSLENDYEDWIFYAMGYVVLAAIGVVLIPVMCIAGCCTCACRTCCGKCGGKVAPVEMPKSDSHPERTKRNCCSAFLFVFATLIFFGSLTMYFTAVRIHSELSSPEAGLFSSVSRGMLMLDDYVNDTVQELNDETLGTYKTMVDDVFSELDEVVTKSYEELDRQAGISANMVPLLSFTSQMPFMSLALNNAQTNASDLQPRLGSVDAGLTAVASDIVTDITVAGCASADCTAMINRVNNLDVVPDYTRFQNAFDTFIIVLDTAIADDLDGELRTGYSDFQAIIDQVNSSVSDEIEVARQAAEDVGEDIEAELDNIEDDLADLDFTEVATDVVALNEDLKEHADYALYGMAGLSALVFLTVPFTYLGILFGCCCPQAKPRNDACCTKKVGATCLLAGVGFTFIFFWLLMILLLVLMLTGGLLHTELCRHLVSLDQSPISGIVDDLLNDTLYEDTGFSISISEIYTSCKNNEAFFTALDAEETFGFDLNALLNTSAIEDEIDILRNADIPIAAVEILTPDAVNALNALAVEVDNTRAETSDAITEFSKDVTNDDLGDLATSLRDLAASETIPSLLQHADTVDTLNGDVTDISDQKTITVAELHEVDDILAINLTAITLNLQRGEDVINQTGSAIVEQVVDEAADNVEIIINDGVGAINNSVRNEIGRCAPVYNAYSTMVDAGCVELLYPVNGYWFALGWSLFFMIVSVIMSLKLATLYRRTWKKRNSVRPAWTSSGDQVRGKR